MAYGDARIWTVIVGLAIGTFLIRLSFLGLVGDRPLPAWLRRLLRYTPVAVLPALVAPLVIWPAGTGGAFDPARFAAAGATVVTGYLSRSPIAAILCGALVLYAGLWLTGQ